MILPLGARRHDIVRPYRMSPAAQAPLLPAGVRCVKPILVVSFALPNGRTAAVIVRRRQRNDQINDPAAHPGVPNAQEGAIELQTLGRGKEIHYVRLRRFFGKPRLCQLRRRPLEEIPWRDFKHPGGMLETTGADPIRAFFVFLDLLECHAEKLAEPALAHAKHRPAHPQPRADVHVDYVGRFGHQLAPPWSPRKVASRSLEPADLRECRYKTLA